MSSLIAGTMRPQDLIPVFFAELEGCGIHGTRELRKIYPTQMILGLDENDPQWSGEVVSDFFIALVDALSEAAPIGMYFGPHPGDGSDFGFWYNSEGEYLISMLQEVALYLEGLSFEEPKVVLRAVKEQAEWWARKIEKYLEELE